MKKSFIKNLLKGIAGLSAVFALVSGCAMSEPEDYSQYAVQSVAGNISNYSTTLSGYSAAEGMTITFKAIDFEGDWDSVIAQTKSARIMAPNLGWWPNGSFYGNIWPSGSQSYGLINGAEYDCMLNGTYDVEVDIDDVIGIRFYVNNNLCVYYSVDDYISLDNRSALVSPETVTIKTLVDTFFEEIKTSVTFGLFYAGGEMENLSVKPGVREIEKEIDITQVSTYPYSYNDELSSKFFAFKNLSADTGVTISFDAYNFLNSAGIADINADWDCIPVKTKNVRLMSPNLGYWPDGLWEANKWPSASNLKNGATFSCMLGLTSDKKVSIAIDSTNGIRYYVNDTLCIQYEPSETIGSITVSTFINKFFEDCSSLVTLGSYENGSTGVMSNLSVKTGVPETVVQPEPEIDSWIDESTETLTGTEWWNAGNGGTSVSSLESGKSVTYTFKVKESGSDCLVEAYDSASTALYLSTTSQKTAWGGLGTTNAGSQTTGVLVAGNIYSATVSYNGSVVTVTYTDLGTDGTGSTVLFTTSSTATVTAPVSAHLVAEYGTFYVKTSTGTVDIVQPINTGSNGDEDQNALTYSVAIGTDGAAYPMTLSSVKVNDTEQLTEEQTITASWSDGYKVSNLSGADSWSVAFTFTMTAIGSNNWNDFNWEVRDDSSNSNGELGYWGGRYDNYMIGWLEGYHEFGDWSNEHLVESTSAAYGGHWYGVVTNTLAYDHSETLNKTCVLTFTHTETSIHVSLTSEGIEIWSMTNDAVSE